jgi:Carboxypeptidase regulatory-like domain
MQKLTAVLFLGFLFIAVILHAQDPAAPPPPQESSPAPDVPRTDSSSKKNKRVPPYVIIGTVFNQSALSFPNVHVQVRKTGDKKFRWETYTNSRGEFAVRVPEGQEYEVVVRAKKYKDVALKVNANNGEMEQRLSIRLETVNSEKDGTKK